MKVIIGLPLSLAFFFLLQLHLALAVEGRGGGNASTSMVYSSNNAVLPNENAKLSWAEDPAPTVVVGHENNQSTQRITETLNPVPRIVGGEPAAKGEFKVRRSLMPD
jgi:hypothetical protein